MCFSICVLYFNENVHLGKKFKNQRRCSVRAGINSVNQVALYSPRLLHSGEALFRLNSTQTLHSSCQENSCSETLPAAKVQKDHLNPKQHRSRMVCGPGKCQQRMTTQHEEGRERERKERRRGRSLKKREGRPNRNIFFS